MYNFKQKLVGITSVASLVVGMFNMPGAGVVSYAEEAQKPIVSSKAAGWTFGIYMCGQNLEEQMGCSTSDLMEILKADVPKGFSKDNNFVIETGGCWGWNYKEMYGSYLRDEKGLTDEEIDQIIPNEIDYSRLSLYKINFEHEYEGNDGKTKTIPALEFVKDIGEYDTSLRDEYYAQYPEEFRNIKDFKKIKKNENPEGENIEDEKEYANMGDSKYLKMFLDELDENYPAEHMAVDLWNHGGGITDGVCYDEYTDDPITLKELKEVLKLRADEGKEKIDLLGYDACLMSNYEIWVNISPYVKTGVGSLTSEPADGWYYTPFVEKLGANYNSDKYTSAELAKDIVKGYEDYYKKDGVLAELIESGEYKKHGDKLGHYKDFETEDEEIDEITANAKLCAVDLNELAITSVKFGALSGNLLDAYHDKDGVNEILKKTVEKGAIEYNYEYEFSGINSLFDAVTEIAPVRAEALSKNDNGFDKHAANAYESAAELATELKDEINEAVIADYKGWEEGGFYDVGAMSIYTPFVYPTLNGYSDTAFFNYNEYPNYSVSPEYARLMYMLGGDIKQLTIDDVNMTPEFSYDAKEDKVSLVYDENATNFLDDLCGFKTAEVNGKKYFIESKYEGVFWGDYDIDMDFESKYFTLTGEPIDAQTSVLELVDWETGETIDSFKELSVGGTLNGREGIFFFDETAGQGFRFSLFSDLSFLYENDDMTDEEKEKVIRRICEKVKDELEEDGSIDEGDLAGVYGNDVNELKVGDKIEFNSKIITGGSSFDDIISTEYFKNYKGNTKIETHLGNTYTVSEKDIFDDIDFDTETESETTVKRYSPEIITKEVDPGKVDVAFGSVRIVELDEETKDVLEIETKSKNFNISKFKAFADSKISVVADEYELTGKEIKPEIKFEGANAKFVEGKDYEVVYENNLGLGKAKVTVKGLDGYDLIADKTVEFNIVEAKKVVAKNGEVKTVYVVVKAPKQVKLKSIKNNKKRAFTIKWKKIKGANGYEVKYALNKKFTKGKVVKAVDAKKTTFKGSKLLKKKTYFVKVRAYTLDANGKKVYGDWSKTKKVKIKR